MPLQTLTSKDGKTITLKAIIGYSIADIGLLYEKLYHPESTIRNIAMAKLAELVFDKNMEEIRPENFSRNVRELLRKEDYGLNIEYFKITSFAIVKTFRLIQDGDWTGESLNMDNKK